MKVIRMTPGAARAVAKTLLGCAELSEKEHMNVQVTEDDCPFVTTDFETGKLGAANIVIMYDESINK